MNDDEFGGHAKLLEAHADYRVVRRLTFRDAYSPSEGRAVARGVIVDTETTGLKPEVSKVIELGLILFEYVPESGEVIRVLKVYDALEDPGCPIPPESTAIHGITDEMVAGKSIDDATVDALLTDVTIVIAHNAEFDRPFLEQRLPIFASLPWACSLRQVKWSDEGFGGASLEYLGYRTGFFFEGHRSEVDCRALLEVISRPLPNSRVTPLKQLLERLSKRDWRVYAVGSAFAAKDQLKERGYRWDDKRRVWHRTLDGDAMREEIVWLKENIYKRDKVPLEFEAFDAITRFSGRPGDKLQRDV